MMVKSFRILWMGLAVLAAFASCAAPKPGDVRLDNVYGVETLGTSLSQSRIVLHASMVNDSGVRVALREACLHLFTPQGEVLEIRIDEPLVLPRRSVTELDVPLTLRFKGGLGALTAIPRLMEGMENVRVSGTFRLQSGGVSKKYEVQDEPFADFLRSIGIDPADVSL